MFSLNTAVRNFSNIYGQLSREEIDFGQIIIDKKILQDNELIINYFFNLVTLNPQIHIGQPFNLIFASSKNRESLVGWPKGINIENYLYMASQNDEPILISKETFEIFSLRLGSEEPKKIASSLGDFIQTLSEIMILSEKFFSKNIDNDDYFILEDDEFIAEINAFFQLTKLSIEVKNFYGFFFE